MWPELVVNHFRDAEGLNTGVGGQSVDSVIANQLPAIKAFNPHLAIFWFGMSALKGDNRDETTAYTEMTALVEDLRTFNPLIKIAVLTQPPVTRNNAATAKPKELQRWNHLLRRNDAQVNVVIDIATDSLIDQVGPGRHGDGVHLDWLGVGAHRVAGHVVQSIRPLLEGF